MTGEYACATAAVVIKYGKHLLHLSRWERRLHEQ